mgnify:CR=1 FL=1
MSENKITPSTLYIVATPIGNLEDISERVVKTLASVDVIYCEDTRRAKKLTDNFSITTPLKSYFVGNEVNKISEIEATLSEGMNVALISDAGTPLISDPGNVLIQKLIQKNYNIVSIPGPSSVLTALTVSGFELNEFQFLGFVPKPPSPINSITDSEVAILSLSIYKSDLIVTDPNLI